MLGGAAPGAHGQTAGTGAPVASIESRRADESAKEAAEAFEIFDFDKLSIDPNNLTAQGIEDLRANFLPEIRPLLVGAGERQSKRLRRIAAPVFRLHQADRCETVVFDHRLPTAFTWKETFVVFSTAALDALDDDEIAALVAHEVGHLYFAARLAAARAEKDDRAARVIELQCDLAALVTLSKLRKKPPKLLSAVNKLIKKRTALHAESFQAGSPSLASREMIYQLYLLYINRKPST